MNEVRGAKNVVICKHSIVDRSRHRLFGETAECTVEHMKVNGKFMNCFHPLADGYIETIVE